MRREVCLWAVDKTPSNATVASFATRKSFKRLATNLVSKSLPLFNLARNFKQGSDFPFSNKFLGLM